MKKKSELETLLELLSPQIVYLSSLFRIKGFTNEDIEQELIVRVIQDMKEGKGQKLGIDGWFLRLKWHLIYIYRKEMKTPLSKSITIENMMNNADDYKSKRRSGKKSIKGGNK